MRDVKASSDALRWDQEVDGVCTLPLQLLTPVKWRQGETGAFAVEVYVPTRDRWRGMSAACLPLIEALAAGHDLHNIHLRVQQAHPDWSRRRTEAFIQRVMRHFLRWKMVTVRTPDPPSVFDGRYETVRQLGRGGMGVVWLCRDRMAADGDGLVAVKHAWNFYGAFARREELLQEEADVLLGLDHPTIARLIRSFHEGGRLHLVREYVDGRRLDQAAFDGTLDEASRRRHVRDVILGIEHMLARGYVYRDPKPTNYFLPASGGHIKLADVGLSTPADPGTRSSSGHIGTHAYAPPEVYETNRVDEAVLVFTMGRFYYHLAARAKPHATPTRERLQALWPRMLERLRDRGATGREIAFIEACCQAEPSARPRTLLEAASMLE